MRNFPYLIRKVTLAWGNDEFLILVFHRLDKAIAMMDLACLAVGRQMSDAGASL